MLLDGLEVRCQCSMTAADMGQRAAPEAAMLKMLPHKQVAHGKDRGVGCGVFTALRLCCSRLSTQSGEPLARACLLAIGAGQPDVPSRDVSSRQTGALPKEALYGEQGHCRAWLLYLVQGVLLSCAPN